MSKKTNKRVLVICQHYWPETFRVTDLCEGLVERGYKVDVLCGIPNYPIGKFFDGYGWLKNRKQIKNGVSIIRVLEIPRRGNSNLSIFINFISFPFFALFYIPKLLFNKYDRIVVYQLSPVFMALPGIILSKIGNIKLYIYICDFWPHSLFSIVNFKNKYLRDLLIKMSYWYYRQANGLVGVFKGIQKRLVTDVGILKEKTIYIPQAPEKLYEKGIFDKKLEKRFNNTFNIVFAGNINPAQSFDTIVKSAKIVYDKGYIKIKYIIIGEGMSKNWLINEVESVGLKNQFIFEGLKPVEEIPKYHTIADALIVALSRSPLFEYGVPAKVNSYMASGKPIIGAMDGDAKRLINRSKSGICVDSEDYIGLSNAIIKLFKMSSKKRKNMGINGQKYHFRHFEREYNLNRLIKFIFNNK